MSCARIDRLWSNLTITPPYSPPLIFTPFSAWFECSKGHGETSWAFLPPGEKDVTMTQRDTCVHKSKCDDDRDTHFWGSNRDGSWTSCGRDDTDHAWNWEGRHGDFDGRQNWHSDYGTQEWHSGGWGNNNQHKNSISWNHHDNSNGWNQHDNKNSEKTTSCANKPLLARSRSPSPPSPPPTHRLAA